MGHKEAVLFLGPPGAGKGTVAQSWREKRDIAYLSTGDMCRTHIREESELGKELDGYISQGQLVPDDLISRMVEEWLKGVDLKYKTLLLDGYPRTAPQVHHWHEMLAKYAPEYTSRVVFFEISLQTVIDRLTSRMICSNVTCAHVYPGGSTASISACTKCGSALLQRSDDEKAVIKRRLQVYEQNRVALLDAYKETNTLVTTFNVERVAHADMFTQFNRVLTEQSGS
ncbi:MAG: nucleoside monophosphate kinase [Candidatus Dependentiae bacterium]|jgi:adenylate kinase